jgi:ribosomal protein S18 acetylase RimI-like enzyme
MNDSESLPWCIRRATAEDAAWIAKLYHDVWHETHACDMPDGVAALRPLKFFVDRMPEVTRASFVGLDRSSNGLGFCGWQGSVVKQLWVAPSARGSGLAVALLDAALKVLAHAGFSHTTLYCLAANSRGLHFYQRQGWHKIEISDMQATQGSDKTVPFWRMEKALHA